MSQTQRPAFPFALVLGKGAHSFVRSTGAVIAAGIVMIGLLVASMPLDSVHLAVIGVLLHEQDRLLQLHLKNLK